MIDILFQNVTRELQHGSVVAGSPFDKDIPNTKQPWKEANIIVSRLMATMRRIMMMMNRQGNLSPMRAQFDLL